MHQKAAQEGFRRFVEVFRIAAATVRYNQHLGKFARLRNQVIACRVEAVEPVIIRANVTSDTKRIDKMDFMP